MIRVFMLGCFGIFSDSGEIALPTNKVRQLAAYLLWQKGAWVRRETLCEMFWGDVDQEHASGSLRTALHFIRRALGEGGISSGFLEIRRDAVKAAGRTECWIDAQVFDDGASKALKNKDAGMDALMAAAALYRGDFLEGMDAHWCMAERQRLQDMYLGILRRLLKQLTSAGLHEAALSYARRWVELNPMDESAHRALMRIYAAIGRPDRVIEQFEYCRRILKPNWAYPLPKKH